jgi:hypothetical protein
MILNEESRALGKQEGKMELVLMELDKQSRQMDRIERKISSLRVKVGSLAGTVSLIVTIVITAIKHYLFK